MIYLIVYVLVVLVSIGICCEMKLEEEGVLISFFWPFAIPVLIGIVIGKLLNRVI